MKTIISFFVFLLLLTSCEKKQDNFRSYFDEDTRLRGSVSFVKHSVFRINNTSSKTLVVEYYCTYDSNYLMGYTYFHYSKKDSSFNKKVYTYNKDGLRTLKDKYGASTYRYDSHKNLLEIRNYNGYGQFEGKILNRYDSIGRVTEQNAFCHEDQLEISSTVQYDSKGNGLETITCFFSNESPYTHAYSSYDSLGNQLERKEYDKDGALYLKIIQKYENIDKAGNWLKRVSYVNDQLTAIEERKIVYR